MKLILILLSFALVYNSSSQTFITPIIGYDKAKLFTPEEEFNTTGGVYVLEEKFNSNGALFGIKISQTIYQKLGISLSYHFSKKLRKPFFIPGIKYCYGDFSFTNNRLIFMFDYSILTNLGLSLGVYTNGVRIKNNPPCEFAWNVPGYNYEERGLAFGTNYKYRFFEFGAYYFRGINSNYINESNLLIAPMESFGIYIGVPVKIPKLFSKEQQDCPKF